MDKTLGIKRERSEEISTWDVLSVLKTNRSGGKNIPPVILSNSDHMQYLIYIMAHSLLRAGIFIW